jgi:hypothetical protein
MLTRERPDVETVDRWAIRILPVGPRHPEGDQHGRAKDWAEKDVPTA